MKKKPSILTVQPVADSSDGYASLLLEVKQRVRTARIKATMAANREMLALYWDIGRLILDRQTVAGWGAKVVQRLAFDLKTEFPVQQGFSPRNLKYMQAFAKAWPTLFSQDSTAATPVSEPALPIVQAPLAQLPWFHHTILLNKLSTPHDRSWYAEKALENGWSGDVMALQIDSGLHLRQAKAVTNFPQSLPSPFSDLAQAITKDPYVFDFLTLTEGANERSLELGLIAHVEQFLLELGVGFALVGRQVRLEVSKKEFYLDLLFYHWKLRCFIVIDLKTREFTPEAAGKMNFYLSAVDSLYRQPQDQPSIGLILCREKDRIIAEYALRDVQKPIGISSYVTKLVSSLPKRLQGSIPTVAEIEAGLSSTSAKKAARKRPKA